MAISRPCHARRRAFTPASSSANLYAQVVKRLAPRKLSSLARIAISASSAACTARSSTSAGPTRASCPRRRPSSKRAARKRSACSSDSARSRASAGPRSAAIHCRDSSGMPGITCMLARATTRAYGGVLREGGRQDRLEHHRVSDGSGPCLTRRRRGKSPRRAVANEVCAPGHDTSSRHERRVRAVRRRQPRRRPGRHASRADRARRAARPDRRHVGRRRRRRVHRIARADTGDRPLPGRVVARHASRSRVPARAADRPARLPRRRRSTSGGGAIARRGRRDSPTAAPAS